MCLVYSVAVCQLLALGAGVGELVGVPAHPDHRPVAGGLLGLEGPPHLGTRAADWTTDGGNKKTQKMKGCRMEWDEESVVLGMWELLWD